MTTSLPPLGEVATPKEALRLFEQQGPRRCEREDLLKLVLDATQDGLLDWDVRGGHAAYSPRWFHLFGFDGDELRDATTPDLWLSLVHPDERENAKRQLDDHLEIGWPFAITVRMAHRAGGYRYTLCRGTSLRNSVDLAERTIIIFSSVDEHVRGEERQRALLAALPDTVLRFNEAGTITALKLGQESPGSPLGELREGTNVRTLGLLSGELIDRLFSTEPPPSRTTIAPGRHDSSHRISKAGRYYDVRAIRCAGDEIICILRDITAERELETHLLQSQKLGAIGQLSAGVAHEINTPMQFIGDNLYFSKDAVADLLRLVEKLKDLARGAGGDATRERIAELEAEADYEYLSAELPRGIERSMMGVERVTRIVRALKSFAHPDAGGFQSTNLRELVESTVTVATNEWKYLANMHVDVPEDVPPLDCVPGELSQVLLNLVVNAAHAIQDVVGNSGEKGEIRVTASHECGVIEIRVSDTGSGIPEQVRPRVFEQFFTTKDVGRGTGMGLSLAYSCVVQRHGGQLTFETEVGRGTTFLLRLPVHQASLGR